MGTEQTGLRTPTQQTNGPVKLVRWLSNACVRGFRMTGVEPSTDIRASTKVAIDWCSPLRLPSFCLSVCLSYWASVSVLPRLDSPGLYDFPDLCLQQLSTGLTDHLSNCLRWLRINSWLLLSIRLLWTLWPHQSFWSHSVGCTCGKNCNMWFES